MNNFARAMPLALALALSWLATAPAAAQIQPNRAQISTKYEPSWNAADAGVYQRLTQAKVLERLQQFLAPLHLPQNLTVKTAPCSGHDTVPYSAGEVTICYDLVNKIELAAAKIYPQDKTAQATVVVGSFIQAALHQTALGIFDVLEIPIWGRKEDAADRLAAFIMVEFGEDLELVGILGATALFKYTAQTGKVWTGSDFADTASPDAQRYYNFLCIAVGADYPKFGGLIEKNLIPDKLRAELCTAGSPTDPQDYAPGNAYEYQQVRKAFLERIMPYVDPDALIKDRATDWLNWTPSK